MELPTLETLLKKAVHFGHKKERSHPKAKKYIFDIRDGINIIDLEMTQKMLSRAVDFVKSSSKEGKTILFLGTKRQAKKITREAAERCSMPYIDQRWLGGMLTNFETIKKSINRLVSLEAEISSENFKKLTKNERLLLERKTKKLFESLKGIQTLAKIPDILFIIDTAKETTAVAEGRQTGILMVGICDTDANPYLVDYPIPANDDAAKSIELITNLIAEAVIEGKSLTKNKQDNKQDKKISAPK